MRGRKSLSLVPPRMSKGSNASRRRSDFNGINNFPKEKISPKQQKAINALEKLKRKLSTAFIPGKTISEFNKQVLDLKNMISSGFETKLDIDKFWDSWDEFYTNIFNYSNKEVIKEQSDQITNELDYCSDCLRSAKKQVKASSNHVNQMIRGLMVKIDEITQTISNSKDLSSSTVQVIVDDLNTMKRDSPTSEFKTNIGNVIVSAQKLRDTFRFKEFISPIMKDTHDILVESLQPITEKLEAKSNQVKERRLSIDPREDQAEQLDQASSEDLESLQAKKQNLEIENEKIQQEINRYRNFVEMYEGRLNQTQEEIDEERMELKRKLREQKKKLSTNPAVAENARKIEELEQKLWQLENDIEERQKYGDAMMIDFFNGEIREIKIKIENAKAELEGINPIYQSISKDGLVEIRVANGNLINRKKELEPRLKQENAAYEELKETLQQSYQIGDNDDDEETMMAAYSKSVIVGGLCSSIASQLLEEKDKMTKSIEQANEQKVDPQETVDWLNNLKADFNNLQTRLNEINLKKDIPSLEELNQKYEDKQLELDSYTKTSKPKLSAEIKKLTQETKKAAQDFLKLSHKHANTEFTSRDIIIDEYVQPTEDLKQACAEYEKLNYEKELAHEEITKLYKLLSGNDPDEDTSFESMASYVLKNMLN